MKKVGYFFLCFVPLILAIAVQILITFPVMGISAMMEFAKIIFSESRMGIMELYKNLLSVWSNQSFNTIVSIGFALSCIFIFGFWYKAQFKGELNKVPKTLFKPGIFISIILMVPGLQMLASMVTSITSVLFPGWMEFYEKLMKAAGLTGELSLLLILYAIFLGPVGEEMIFRGVTLASAKCALPFWAANLFQAALFGVFHLNVIQGIYAFFIGLFLGYVCEKGKSIYYSIFLHIFFNAWGTLMPTELLNEPMFAGIFLIVSILVGIAGFLVFNHKIKQESQAVSI
ncbi:MAG: CPBP family intramembrane metalloprotease [Lachnospiraceae bacterium]|nr:CPBP family intramembrane metalloprotease [Lachnospiraceae bacterium]